LASLRLIETDVIAHFVEIYVPLGVIFCYNSVLAEGGIFNFPRTTRLYGAKLGVVAEGTRCGFEDSYCSKERFKLLFLSDH